MLCPQCCGQFLLPFTHFCSCIICISLIAELLETLTGWTRWMPVHCRAAAWLLQRSSKPNLSVYMESDFDNY